MKTIAIVCAIVALAASPLLAAGVTDATKPLGHLKYSVAVEDNYVFERDIDVPENRTKFELEDVNQIYGVLALGLTPYFNVYAKLGASDGGEVKDYSTSSINLDIETDYGFLWGVGLSGVKEITSGWKVGLDTQFNWSKADVDKITMNGTLPGSNISGDIVNFEFQATPFVTRMFDVPRTKWVINPYVGPVFSYFKTITDDNISYTAAGAARVTSWTLKGDDYVGIVVGTDLVMENNASIKVEGRFIDETAITAGATYRF